MGIEELEEYVKNLSPVGTWGCGVKRDRVWADKSSLLYFISEIKKQLKSSLPAQQDKVVVPQVADDHIKEGLTMGASKVEIICCAESYSTAIPNDEFSIWFRKNEKVFIKALANGYTVKKEQLYYVAFGYDRFLVKSNAKFSDGTDFIWIETLEEIEQQGIELKHHFTEKEIKAINEKYWVFRHPVEEEAE